MLLQLAACLLSLGLQDPVEGAGALPRIELERVGQRIEQSCVLVFPDEPVAVGTGQSAVRIEGDGLRIVCEGELRGAGAGTDPDRLSGIGLHLTGEGIELSGARVAGYRVGILAERADGARLSELDVSGNFRQRLASTWEREASGDWLWPHDNDEGQWLERYGAGLAVRDSAGVGISEVLVRRGQNGIVLERVSDSTVERCDASFLSGWGLAMWRSSRNRIEGNRFDYCVRGYVHGRYNRGQDSAGILLFEQACDNLFEWNSATHGGDGVFGFAGNEALGEAGEEPEAHLGLGCNGNVFRNNDLSFAAAHGFELTFSFDNRIERNWIEGNAICGIWLGYGRDSVIVGNRFVGNGDAGYGMERGAINAEHGQRIQVLGNRMEGNALGVSFWTDVDVHLRDTPWALSNGSGARGNVLGGNRFDGPGPWLHLSGAADTVLREPLDAARIEADAASAPRVDEGAGGPSAAPPEPWTDRRQLQEAIERRRLALEPDAAVELSRPVLEGRDHVVLDAWGPIDFERPFLQPLGRGTGAHAWRLLGAARFDAVTRLHGAVELERAAGAPGALEGERLTVRPKRGAGSSAYAIEVVVEGERQRLEGWLCAMSWDVVAFPYTADPRSAEDEWRGQAAAEGALTAVLPDLELAFGGGGPSRRLGFPGDLAGDRFGVLAACEVELPAGQFLLRTVSDDGVRVKVGGRTVIERWDHHGATEDGALIEVGAAGPVRIEVEYFELDGAAVLEVELRPLP